MLGTIAALARRSRSDQAPGDKGEVTHLSLAADVAEGALFAAALGYAGGLLPQGVRVRQALESIPVCLPAVDEAATSLDP